MKKQGALQVEQTREPASVEEALAPDLAGLRQKRIAERAYGYAESAASKASSMLRTGFKPSVRLMKKKPGASEGQAGQTILVSSAPPRTLRHPAPAQEDRDRVGPYHAEKRNVAEATQSCSTAWLRVSSGLAGTGSAAPGMGRRSEISSPVGCWIDGIPFTRMDTHRSIRLP